MREAEIDPDLCDGCQDCIEQCLYDAIDLVRIPPSKRLKAYVDPDICVGCHACAPSCPLHVIAMNLLRPRKSTASDPGLY